MIKRQSVWPVLQIIAGLGAIMVVVLPIFLSDAPWPTMARDYLEQNGTRESGAVNLVSAIYLGYRAFDTLGETIVLLVAVNGTIGILTTAGAMLAKGFGSPEKQEGAVRHHAEQSQTASFTLPVEKRKSQRLRTHLIEVVTGTLAPIVLLFGFYVMLYGHLSPGGGFQGGVVIASGIVFLALGNRMESSTRLTRADVLGRIEATAFLLLIVASVSGILAGVGFFGNPLHKMTILPAGFIILLNSIIGLKVGAGIGFMCIAILGKEI